MADLWRRASEVKKIVLCYEDRLPASWLEGINKLRGKLERGGIEVGGSILLLRLRQAKDRAPGTEVKLGVDIINAPIDRLPADANIILTHKRLAQRAKQAVPTAWVIPLTRFFIEPVYDEIVANLVGREAVPPQDEAGPAEGLNASRNSDK